MEAVGIMSEGIGTLGFQTVCIFTPEVPSSLRSHGAAIIAIAQNFAGRGELGARARRMKSDLFRVKNGRDLRA